MLKPLILLLGVISGCLIGQLSAGFTIGVTGIACALILRAITGYLVRWNVTFIIFSTRLHYVWPSLLFFGLESILSSYSVTQPKNLPTDVKFLISATVEQRTTFTYGERYRIRVNHMLPMPESTVKLIEKVKGNEGKVSGSEYAGDKSEIKSSIECRNLELYLMTPADLVMDPGEEILYTSRLRKAAGGGIGNYPKYSSAIRKKENLKICGVDRSLFFRMQTYRERLIIKIENLRLDFDSTSLLRALIAGDRGRLRKKNIEGFKDAGIAHSLAVSGMHVGIFTSILTFLTLPLCAIGKWKWRLPIILAGIWLFTFLTGLEFSTFRAALMLTLAVAALLSERRRNPFGSVCMAGIAILMISPMALWDPGFQLSFCCVAALCLFVEPLNPVNHSDNPRLYKLTTLVLSTIIATGATWQLTGYYFGTMPVNFLIANLIILPLLPLFMVGGLFILLSGSLGWQPEIISKLIGFLTSSMLSFIDMLRGTVIQLEVSNVSLILWFVGLILLAIGLHYNRPSYLFTSAGGGINEPNMRFYKGNILIISSGIILLIFSILALCL